MNWSVTAVLLCLASAANSRLAAAQSAPAAPHFPTNEDLRHTRDLRDPQLSPDGRLVLVSVTEPTADSAATHVWIVDREAGTSHQLTFQAPGATRGESQARWAADGRSVFFTARRGRNSQLFQLPMAGGEAKPFDLRVVPLVDESRAPDAVDGDRGTVAAKPIAIDVSSYALSPDGAFAAIVARDPQPPGEKKQRDDKADANWVDHDAHGTRTYLLDLRTAKLTAVAVPPDVRRVVWSHRSDRFLAETTPGGNVSDLGPADTTWLVTVSAPEHPTRIAALPPTIGSAVWSADDATLYFTAQAQADAPPGVSDLYELSIANSDIKDLSNGFKGTVSAAA
ncbi:MAG: hypothetical protein ABI205_07405, partial [Gemmatimonadaceae bacterium]